MSLSITLHFPQFLRATHVFPVSSLAPLLPLQLSLNAHPNELRRLAGTAAQMGP